jgi:ribosomal protein L23
MIASQELFMSASVASGAAAAAANTIKARGKGVTLPNMIFKLIKPGKPLRENQVCFKVPLNVNKMQIRNYLEEIYKLDIVKVDTSILLGKRRLNYLGFHFKRPDVKKAYVTLKDKFEFPEFVNPPPVRKPKAGEPAAAAAAAPK